MQMQSAAPESPVPSDPRKQAATLLNAHFNRQPFRVLDLPDCASAYRVQDEVVALLEAHGAGRREGYKIALASPAVQRKCGLREPIVGAVLETGLRWNSADIDLENYQHLGVECEICFQMGQALDAAAAPFTQETVMAAVDLVCPALDVLDDRHLDYAALHPPSLIAENTCSAGVILGGWKPLRKLDLETMVAQVSVFMADEAEGASEQSVRVADSLDHAALLTWLANHLAGRGIGMRAGEIVLSGALLPALFPKPRSWLRYRLQSFDEVGATFF